MPDSNQQTVLFKDPGSKPVKIQFDLPGSTSDAGLLLFTKLDQKLNLTKSLATFLSDSRSPSKVKHQIHQLFQQRVFGLAAGYEDANDAAKIKNDPFFLQACGKGEDPRDSLGSQSTLSRFENMQDPKSLHAMGRAMERFVIQSLKKKRKRAKRIFLDFDSTCDKGHGRQQLLRFHNYYGSWCYLPLLGFISFQGDREQYLFHTRLRAGTVRDYKGVAPVLRRVVPLLRKAFPKTEIVVRMDGGFYFHPLLKVIEELGCSYLIGYRKNPVLRTAALATSFDALYKTIQNGKTTQVFAEVAYQARSWKKERRVIYKAEWLLEAGHEIKENLRFILTNMKLKPRSLWKLYTERGDTENRIKELKLDLQLDRTSCSRFVANQLRALMAATAYILFQELRWHARKTELARASVGRLRLVLLKVGGLVKRQARWFLFRLPKDYGWRKTWMALARELGAVAL
jgi:hypothetical protein